ncbi:GTP-binding protein [Pelomonas sp. Root1217]|uniref:putative glycoside hydrolase n=1 Tax=Pelomonas sp. Root1217 TaxID=1736430 RepID=UPI00070ABD5B|nr:putative glycoside hydrolase [Pelomonas sp. Root1217]KQV59559.1 GTP-binding protein [Pelomonas sp. Root1217]
MNRLLRILATVTLCLCMQAAGALDVVVRDAQSGRPLGNATVVVGSNEFRSDEQGRLAAPVATEGTLVTARAVGYARFRSAVGPPGPLVVPLKPLRPKALYLSAYGVGSATLRGDALKLIAETELNALVIDVKDDRGIVPYRSPALAAAGLAQPVITVRDMQALMRELQGQSLYLIARIVTFKDDPYAAAHPAWAVHEANGDVWKDREGLAWIDPFRREAWERNLALAEEAAALGFDEIQFDYLRFPDALGLIFAEPDTQERRIAAIGDFLDAARRRLARYNVFIAADVFGYVAWNRDDTHIGQHLESIMPHVDYLSPMLYPSGFTFGIPGHRDPVAAPYEIVHHSLQRALERTGLPGMRLRPWLQAFRDYAFDRRLFGEREIRLQIDAADALGTDGWMLWNASNRYQEDGLDRDEPPRP